MKPKELKYSHWLKYNSYFFLQHWLGYVNFKKFFGKGSNELFKKIDKDIAQSATNQTLDIPTLDPSVMDSDIKKFRAIASGPVLFRGAANDWPATKKWNLDFFEEEYGDRQILMNDLVGTIDPNNPQEFRWISLKKYIGLMRDGSLEYLKFSPLVQNEVSLQQDLNVPWLNKFDFPISFGRTFYMFMGGEGTVTPIHNEYPSVVYIQVSGHKKWTMILPQDRIFLDPRTERKIYFYTNADPRKTDNADYPLFKYARKFQATLGPGDVLWFPPFAWHHVENMDESIGVSYKFANIGAAARSSKMLSALVYLATKPNLFFAFFASRFKKSDYSLTRKESDL